MMIDMPLEEMRTYTGRNPRPDDFDAYWQRALSQLDAVSMDYSLEVADFSVPNVECCHLYFTGVEGARLHARFLRPAHIEGRVPAVALFHGYRGHCGDWISKLAYPMAGICVAALDTRGQSGLSEDNLRVSSGSTFYGHIIRGIDEASPDSLLFKRNYLDTVQLVRILMSMPGIDAERIGVAGFSQGGGLSLACAALEPRVKFVAAGYPFLTDYLRVWELDYAEDAYEELKIYFRLKDPMHQRAPEFWRRLGYIDVQHLAPRIAAETVFFTALMDTTCPPSTQFAAYNKITAPKSMILYPDYTHETLPFADEQVFSLMRQKL